MPRSAIEAGLADIIAPAAELPDKIAAYLSMPSHPASPKQVVAPAALSALEKIIIMLRDRCGSDFSEYKTNTLYRRIERRTALHQLEGIAAYVRYPKENPLELDLLFKELLIGVTSFFRDHAVWDTLRDSMLPAVLARHPGGAVLRAWVPACSSGEEAYSLAICFMEALEAQQTEDRYTLQIYATDIDADAIDKAHKGFYPENIASDVSAERLARFFVPEEGGNRVGKSIRDMVVFAPQNLISDPPFTKLDILSCHNLLIYLGQRLQKRLLPLFHYALNKDGLLLLGSAETVGGFGELFEAVDGKSRIFRRLDQEVAPARLEFPAYHPLVETAAELIGATGRRDNLEYLTDQLLQQNFAPPAVLVSADGDILYISGRTGKYLEPAAGKVNITSTSTPWHARACARRSPTSVEGLVGHAEANFNADPEEVARVLADDQEVMNSRVDKHIAEERVTFADGSVHFLATSKAPLIDAQGGCDRILGVATDITARKAAEQALLEESRRKDEFLAMLAHELRNPLTPIRNAAHVLGLLDVEEPCVRWAKEVIERQLAHLTRLVDELLDVARIARGKVSLKKGRIDLADLVRQACESVQALMTLKGHHFEVSLQATPLMLEGDQVRLVQVLQNLLNNAAKYTPEGGRISLTARQQGKELEIQVRDNGSGMSADLLPWCIRGG